MTVPRTGGRTLLSLGLAVVLAAVLLLFGAVVGGPSSSPAQDRESAGPSSSFAGIQKLQDDLRRVPANHRAWAELGIAYVQQARLTADPSFYSKAEGALAESLRLRPRGNDLALTGRATLAAARHEFTQAVRLADRALAVNAYSASALAVKVDGLTELGRYDESRKVLQRLLDLRPGLDSFTRASYVLELQGDVAGARTALERAVPVATAPADRAFVHFQLGELSWVSGDLAAATAGYDAALRADGSYVSALAGRAKVRAAQGDIDGALTNYRAAVARQPQPATLIELGELLQGQGRAAEAEQQFAVVRATQQVFAASGQVVDVELALFEADHGDAGRAVQLAQQGLQSRPDSIFAQDAAAWALHAAGRDTEALPLARAAARTGLRSASLWYHLGAIEAAVGDVSAARRNLTRALELNPAWSPLHAPRARTLLEELP